MKTRTLMKKRWLPLAIVPLFSVAVLSGCSSDDDDTTGGGTVVADGNGDGPADPTVTAADENGNFIDDSYEVAEIGGANDTNGDGIDDAAALLLAGGTTTGSTTTGETTGSTTTGETTGGTTTGETTGGTTTGETTGGTTTGGTTGGTTTGGGTTGGGQTLTGSLNPVTVSDSSSEIVATSDFTWDGTRLTGSVDAADVNRVALFQGIAASAAPVQELFTLNSGPPTFFMPNPLSDQENGPVAEGIGSGNLFLEVTTNSGQTIRSTQLLPPGKVLSASYVPLEVATSSGFNSNGAAYINVNTVTRQYSAVVTVNLDVSDLGTDGTSVSVAAAHVHSGTAAGPVIIPLTMDSPTAFSASGTLSETDYSTIQQNNGWFNVHQNDGTTPGASFLTGQIIFAQP